ncbi:MAG: hypothetical protein RJA57_525 [Bacteroidota bacterium]|jgi:phenylalanyl-tRNA synthetase beta chain
MTISYKWLCDYLPAGPDGQPPVDPERLSRILTAVGLEVEHMQAYEEVKGGLTGLVIGEVLHTEKHPNATKLTLTRVSTGGSEPLAIVCGAPNVAIGQKVVVAPVGATIYPINGAPLTMNVAKIRGVESHGMICAEDEIGLGPSHDGILVLSDDATPGMTATAYFQPYTDTIYEIGLTPNRMDAMSHWGVARDVCAYLSHHDKKDLRPKLPLAGPFRRDSDAFVIEVNVEHEDACPRYSGVSIDNIRIGPSPKWLQQRLKAIGVRPINNIVDITNYIQHETGQPLHAFDADAITGRRIEVRFAREGETFVTLDEKERKLDTGDLLICDTSGPLCMAGVFGGLHSGVTDKTRNIFLESACFDSITVRRSSFRHGLRTDAATRFEKGTDIAATVPVLKRAALLIKELCGGDISSDIIDCYPVKRERTEVAVKWHYLKKLSGKNYHPDSVRNILESLGFEILKEGVDEFRVAVPLHKPDIGLAADVVEEIIRIDGLDHIEIPGSITITPSVDDAYFRESCREKTAGALVGMGFQEMLTNSITHLAYFSETEQATLVRMLNSLSAELNVMRPSLLETALEVVALNLNRKNQSLRLFEFGRTYRTPSTGRYLEQERLALVLSGPLAPDHWKQKAIAADLYYLKGVTESLLEGLGLTGWACVDMESEKLTDTVCYRHTQQELVVCGTVRRTVLDRFGIRQPVFFAEWNWDAIIALTEKASASVTELPRFPAVERDLALVVASQTPWHRVRDTIRETGLEKLRDVRLFDIFESEKLGAGRKSMAVNFTFQDIEKTLTDKEIDGWMQTIMTALTTQLQAEIRK